MYFLLGETGGQQFLDYRHELRLSVCVDVAEIFLGNSVIRCSLKTRAGIIMGLFLSVR